MTVRLASVPARLGVAAAAVGAGFLLREALTWWLGPGLPVYITFYPAVMVVAVVAGLLPGLAATALSALVVAYWVLPPRGRLEIHHPADLAGLVLFCTMGAFMSVVAELYRRNREQATVYERELALQQAQRQSEEALRRVNADLAQRNDELTEQSEELSQQAEELQAQSEEIRVLNVEMGHREKLLQALLESLRQTGTERAAMTDICVAALEIFGEAAGAAAVYERQAGQLVIRASAGLGDGADPEEPRPVDHRFARLVVEQNRTASVADVSLRPDLSILAAPGAPPYQAVLGAPMRAGDRAFGAFVLHSRQRQEWTVDQFRLAEWMAAQCAHVLEILRLQDDLRRQAALIDLSPDAIMGRRMDGTITLWGHGAEMLYGWTRQEATGASTHSLLATRFPQPLVRIEDELERTGRWSGDLTHATKDGREVVVQSRWLARRDGRGAIVELLESNVDITESRRATDAIERAAEQNRLALSAAELGAWDYRFDTGDVYWDERCRDMFGIAQGARIEYDGAIKCIHPEDRAEVDRAVGAALAGVNDGAYHREFRVVWPDGSIRWIASSGRVHFHGTGAERRALRFIGVNRDITEQKQAEEAIREGQRQNAFLASVIEFASQPFGVGYPDGRLGLINKAFERLTGYTGDELRAIDWAHALTPPEWQDDEHQKLDELRATGQPLRYEKEYLRKDGTRVPVELLVHMVTDSEGEPRYYYSFITDITVRKQAEQALRESEERFRIMADSAPMMIWVTDAEGGLQFVNRTYREFFGVTYDEVAGGTWQPFLHPTMRPRT